MNDALPPAGWYADPEQPGRQRWWNGTAWTSDFAPADAEASVASSPAASQLQTGWRPTALTIVVGVAAAIVALISLASSGIGGLKGRYHWNAG